MYRAKQGMSNTEYVNKGAYHERDIALFLVLS